MSNILTKLTALESYQPPDYWQYTEGYSYFKADTDAALTGSGRDYAAIKMQLRGYNVTAADMYESVAVNTYIFELSYVPNDFIQIDPATGQDRLYKKGWRIQWGFVPKTAGGWDVPDFLEEIPENLVDTPPDGKTVNVPPSNELITPPIETREVPIIGWNGSAVSVDSFKEYGHGTFSIPVNVEGVVVGLNQHGKGAQSSSYQDIIYAVFAESGVYRIFVNGIDSGIGFEAYTSSDVFKIEANDFLVRFYKNDILKHTEPLIESGLTYVLDASLHRSGDAVNDVVITQATAPIITAWNDLDYIYHVETAESGVYWVDDDLITVAGRDYVYWIDEDSILNIDDDASLIRWNDEDSIAVYSDLEQPNNIITAQWVDRDSIFVRPYPLQVLHPEYIAVQSFEIIPELIAWQPQNLYPELVVIQENIYLEAELIAPTILAIYLEAELIAVQDIQEYNYIEAELIAATTLIESLATTIVDVSENVVI